MIFMVEETVSFEKDYLEAMDYDESLESKLKECMQGKYKLVLDFTKVKKGVHGDYYCDIFNTCIAEIEKQGKDPAKTLTENLTLLFQSRKSSAYEMMELIGTHQIFNCRFNDEKTIAFEQEYLSFKDLASIEEKLREYAYAGQKLILDFSKIKGAAGDFLAAVVCTYLNELENQGKEIDLIKEKVTLVFESDKCPAYENLKLMGIDSLVSIEFKNKTYKNTSENQ